PMSLTIVIGATQIAARLLPHTAPRNLMAPGMLLAAVGMLLLTRLSMNSAYTTEVLPALVLLGLGMGLTFMPVYATATAGVAPKDAGVTSAAVSTFQQIGGSLGIVLLNTIASSAATRYTDAHLSPSRNPGEGLVHGFNVAAWWSAGILLLAALAAAMAKTPEKP
ncbi:MFS transporter, partial [Streptomyces sp. NPDC057552]|uniref:MFS transporter n=1 Tax=Streptomyces sp. NPDC057552 TaxID=3350537 RepID=UPI0036838B5D